MNVNVVTVCVNHFHYLKDDMQILYNNCDTINSCISRLRFSRESVSPCFTYGLIICPLGRTLGVRVSLLSVRKYSETRGTTLLSDPTWAQPSWVTGYTEVFACNWSKYRN